MNSPVRGLILFTLASTLTVTAATTNTFMLPPRAYTLPLMSAPTLDGVIGTNEWPTLSLCRLIECAIPTQPMTPSMFLHGRDGGLQVGSDGTNLYVAYRSSLHPQLGAVCTGKRDPVKESVRIGQDDSVEIWLDPAPDSTDSVAAQIIGNCRGDTLGLFFLRGSVMNTQTWPVPGFRQAHGVTNGEWTAEYAIPLAAFGITNAALPFGVRLCRSFTAPMNQCRWEAGTTLFSDPKTMCRVAFREAAPIVRETGFFDHQGLHLGLEVRNATSKPIELKVSLKGTVDGQETGRDWADTLTPGETKPYSLARPIIPGQPGLCEARMDVTDKDGTPYFTRTAKWKTPLKAEWMPVTLTRPAATTDVEFAWNPLTKTLHVDADYSGLPDRTAIKAVRWEVAPIPVSDRHAAGAEPVTVPASPAKPAQNPTGTAEPFRSESVGAEPVTVPGSSAKPIRSGSVPGSPSSHVTTDLALPQFAEGEYELRLFFDGAAKATLPAKTLRFAHLDPLDLWVGRAVPCAPSPHQDATNLVPAGDIETATNNIPAGWRLRSGDVTVATNQAHGGRQCLRLARQATITAPFIAKRSDAYWISFQMKGTPDATLRLAFSGAWKDWQDFKTTGDWKAYRFLKTYRAGDTNTLTLKAEDGKSEFLIDDLAVTPILNRLGSPFSSHMVMQRGKPIPVWGRTHFPNQAVAVEFAGEKRDTVSDENGYWRVFFKARDKGGPYTLKVSDIAGELTDIVMGDVWICAGQSNMHFGLDNVNGLKTNAPEVVAKASNDNLRLWFDPGRTALTPSREHMTLIDPERSFGLWQRCTPETVLLPNTPGSWRGFSAVGYFFGQAIQPAAGVPIGLVEIAVGGTSAETWTSPIGIAGLDNVPLPAVDPKNLRNDTPSAYWNGSVAPVVPMPIKGILWYQGESNSGQSYWYDRVLANLIRDWRLHFRQGDVPFYFVQICAMDGYQPFDTAWAHLRESQLRVAQSGMSNVAMAVSYDLEDEDNPWDVHPRNKKAVADRLARIALARDYGQKDIVYQSPVYREMKREGSAIRLFFDYAEGGLVCARPGSGTGNGSGRNGEAVPLHERAGSGDFATNLNGFRLLDDQGRFHDAQAVIDPATSSGLASDTVVVSAPGVGNPTHVRYAFVQYTFPKPNLYSKAGLPASPFRTDGP